MYEVFSQISDKYIHNSLSQKGKLGVVDDCQ